MKFATFNIRTDKDQDGNNSFRYRKPLVLRTIAEKQPDIICFQEVLPHVADWLRENLTGFTTVGCGRNRGCMLGDEQLTVAFRADKYNLVEMNTFWMSPTPYVPGSRFEEQSTCPRVVTEVLLFDKANEQVVRVLNVHLDHRGAEARRLGLKQALEHIDSHKLFPDAAVIMAGDFNDFPDSIIWNAFSEHGEWVDVTADSGFTFHNYGTENTEKIDYIYVRGNLACKSYEKWTQCEDGVYLSDHYPLCAELEWKN